MEEVGELAHATLKGEQGIRYVDLPTVQAEKVDAVGDIVIFLAGYCSRHNIDFDRAVEETWNKVKARDWVADPITGGEA